MLALAKGVVYNQYSEFSLLLCVFVFMLVLQQAALRFADGTPTTELG